MGFERKKSLVSFSSLFAYLRCPQVVIEGGTGQEGVGSSVLLLMVRDAYANYVVQTAIDVVPEGNEKRMLLEELKANEVQLVSGIFRSSFM